MRVEETAPLIQWIVSEGLEGTPETRLLEGLCGRLTAAGSGCRCLHRDPARRRVAPAVTS